MKRYVILNGFNSKDLLSTSGVPQNPFPGPLLLLLYMIFLTLYTSKTLLTEKGKVSFCSQTRTT